MPNSSGPRQLIEETEWLRVYRVGPNDLLYESKFVRDGVEISAKEIMSRWSTFTPAERIDFVIAFQSKYPLSAEDEEIVEFLMDVGDDDIWPMITLPIISMSGAKRERAVEFLLDRVQTSNRGRANYYQALAALGDPRSVNFLKIAYEQEQARVRDNETVESFADITVFDDYLNCCSALYKLTGEREYTNAIHALAEHNNEMIRRKVELILRQMG
jgi:hypothetical protein